MARILRTKDIQNATRRGGKGGGLVLDHGTYYVEETIELVQIRGFILKGRGAIGTELEWVGDNTSPMITMNNCQGSAIEKLSITASADYPLLFGVRAEKGEDGTGDLVWSGLDSSFNTLRDVIVSGGGYVDVGFHQYRHPDSNSKNDFMELVRVQVANVNYAGAVLEGRNGKGVVFRNCHFQGTNNALYAVDTVQAGYPSTAGGSPRAGTYNAGGSFHWYGGGQTGFTAANMRIGDRNDTIGVFGCYSEDSARLLQVPAYGTGSSGGCPVVLQNYRFAIGAETEADMEIIQFYAPGPLVLLGCRFGSNAAGSQGRIRFQPTPAPGAFTMQGCFIANDGDGEVFPYATPNNADYPTSNIAYSDGTVALGSGVVVETDGPSSWPYPLSAGQWASLCTGAPAPDGQWLLSTANVSAWAAATAYDEGTIVTKGGYAYLVVVGGTSGSTGPVGTVVDGTETDNEVTWKCLGAATGAFVDQIGSHHMLATGTLEYQQALTNFTRTGVHFAQATPAEGLSPVTTAFGPATNAIAWKWDMQITTVSGSDRAIMCFNTGSETDTAGAIKVKIKTTGEAQLFVDASTADGTYVYEGSGLTHRFVAVYDKAAAVFYLFTDQEALSISTTGETIVTSSNVCLGAANGQTADCIATAPAVWVGQSKIDVIKTTAWRTAMGVL